MFRTLRLFWLGKIFVANINSKMDNLRQGGNIGAWHGSQVQQIQYNIILLYMMCTLLRLYTDEWVGPGSGLLHLKSIQPLWKISENCSIYGYEFAKCTNLLCDFMFYLEVPKQLIYLKFAPSSRERCFLNLLQRVGGIQKEMPNSRPENDKLAYMEELLYLHVRLHLKSFAQNG